MNRTRIATLGIACFIGSTLVIAFPTTSGATSPTTWAICPAIDSESLCAPPQQHRTNAQAPTVVAHALQRSATAVDDGCWGVPIVGVYACVQ